MSSRAHVLVLPYPAQGHVIPLMQLSHELVKHEGIKVTFVNTDFNHKQIMKALGAKDEEEEEQQVWNGIRLVSIPDGLEDGESRSRLDKLTESIIQVMPKKLEMLIQEINDSDSDKISCVVADGNIGMALEVAEKMGIQRIAAFWPASASILALFFNVEKLLHQGIIDTDGTATKDQIIQLSPEMPAMKTKEFVWAQIGDDLNVQKLFFNFLRSNNKAMELADWVICNSSHELESSTFAFASEIMPIGPLLSSRNHVDKFAGSFWPEDSTCLNWLDQQPHNSVIYIAFGSFTVFDHTQLQELALGLELSNKPFLWVVRSDINDGENYEFLKEFEERLCCRGKVVGWAPQQKVLTHPSIACFLSHCGWNSTIEGVTNGMPFLCWPYFADQFVNETYICDIWKVGLRLDRNHGIIGRGEILNRVKQVLNDEGFKTRALELKEKVLNSVKEGGSSSKNMKNFIDWIKA